MHHLEFSLYALAIAIFFLTLYFVGFIVQKKLSPHQLPFPPGPKALPFLGCALEINKSEPWLTFGEWKTLYGEIVSCELLGQTYVIINSEKVAKALLEQRSNVYSDRPVVRTCSLFGMDFNTGHLSCNDIWNSYQKIFYQNFNSSSIHKYHDFVAETARVLLVNLLHSPESFEKHMKTYSASIVMSITYGYNVVPRDYPLEAAVEEMMRIVALITPERAVLLSHFPQLLNLPSWFPGAELRRLAKRCKESSPRIGDASFQFVKECLSKDIENDSMVAQLLKEESQGRDSREQEIKNCATSSFIAGIYTIQSSMSTLIMALILYPEVQDRAQVVIDRIVGRGRPPTFNDRASLQYVDALLRETLRWGSLVPMAIPHIVTKDVIFQQRLIPKGAIMIQNLWGMARDEERFSDPTAFKPERHLDADGNLLPDDVSCLYFGYGSSVCPGRYLSDASAWLAVANMLSMFKFSKAIGPAGYEVDVFPKFTGGVVRRPVPFSCCITPRFEEAIGVVDQLERGTTESTL